MTYGLVRATLQAAVPPCTQSVLVTMRSDQVQHPGTDCMQDLALAG
jgi:hypothetical protein